MGERRVARHAVLAGVVGLVALAGCKCDGTRSGAVTSRRDGGPHGSGASIGQPAPVRAFVPLRLAAGARHLLGANGPRHADQVDMVSFSPDGRRLASIDRRGGIFVWDAASGAPIERRDSGTITSLPVIGFAGDQLVVRGPTDMLARQLMSDEGTWTRAAGGSEVVEVASGRRVIVPDLAQSELARFSIAGGTIAAIVDRGAVIAGRLGQPLTRIAEDSPRRWYAAVSPDGGSVALIDENPSIRIRSVTGPGDRTIAVPSLGETDVGVTAVAWSPDAASLALAIGTGPTIIVVDVKTGRARELARDTFANDITFLVYSPDGRTLAGGTKYGRVRLWDASTGALVHAHDGHIGAVWDVDIADDSATIVSAGDERVLQWRPEDSPRERPYGDHEHWVTHAALSPDGSTMASCSDYGDINVRAVATGARLARLQIKGSSCDGLALRNGQVIASNGTQAQVFAPRDDAPPRTFELAAGRKWGSSVFAVSHDGSLLASGGDDGFIAVHAVATGGRQWRIEVPKDPERDGEHVDVDAVAFDPAGKTLATITGDLKLSIRDARTGRLLRAHPIPRGCGTDVTFAGERVAVACGDEVHVFDKTGAEVATVRHRDGGAYSIAATATRLVIGGGDGSVSVWDLP